MATTWFARLFPGELHHCQGLRQEMLECLPPSGRLLDLGCGDNAAFASFRSPTREIWGTDLQAHPHLQDPDWFRRLPGDGRIPFPDDYFDVVVSVMVLEHVRDPEAFFQEAQRVLREGGHFIGHSISGCHYVTGLRRLFGLLPHHLNQAMVQWLYQREEFDTFPAYYRANREGQIRTACRRTSLVPVRLRRYADQGYFRFWKPLMHAAGVADYCLDQLLPGCGRLYFTVTLRKERGVAASNSGMAA